jgi:hypothetical protein
MRPHSEVVSNDAGDGVEHIAGLLRLERAACGA